MTTLEWLYRVGMPAKSGVSGGVIAVLPGQLGIGVFSPLLDSHYNSIRGLQVCDDLSRHLDLHLFNTPHANKSVIRLKFTAAEVNSNRIRTKEETEVLRVHGGRIQVFQLQGNLVLSTAEVVLYDVISAAAGLDTVILDFKHALSINESASRLFYQLLLKLQEQGKTVIFTKTASVLMLRRYMKRKMKEEEFDRRFVAFDDNDTALEWCENRLLDQKLAHRVAEPTVAPAGYELLANLSRKKSRWCRHYCSAVNFNAVK